MPGQIANPPSTCLLLAAQYLRMSTEHQQYSIANQSAAIALYAAAHNIGIVRLFTDGGKSGTSIKHRSGLQELLKTVVSGVADFDLILVYDVSRWGRFPDADEAAHYEFLCKKTGVPVRYCAEQFENDNSTTSNLLKALKRTMAGEYSRELSTKVGSGQRRLAEMGYWQGGVPPYAMQRRIVNQNGELKEVLKFGQWKSISTERVVLTLGPQNEVETIQLAFDLFTRQRKTRYEIADILNQRKTFWGNKPWDIVKLRKIFDNPVYKGAYPYRKHHLGRELPRDKWLVREHAFPAIISEDQWQQARDRIRKEVKRLVESEMLEELRRLWKRKGTLNSNLINAAKDVPSVEAYVNHFGGINETYKLIGFPLKRDLGFLHSIRMSQNIGNEISEHICSRVRAIGGTAERLHSPRRILLNGNVSVRVKVARGYVRWHGVMRWVLLLGKRFTTDIVVFGRLEPPNPEVLDYFVIPALSQLRGALSPKRESNPPFLGIYRFPTLDSFIETFCCLPLLEKEI
jgi:DNA invertase Pin-like site-specific DNA recombinase